MKDKKLQDAINEVCSCCPYISEVSDAWDENDNAFYHYKNASDKYCERCMVRKMQDYYDALDKHDWSEDMPEYQAIVNY